MNRLNRRAALLGLSAGVLGACTDTYRIGDSGKKAPKGGIGGTGIVGTLTDFGSLIVNGLIVQTDTSTEITDALGSRDASQLAIGQSLTIEAERRGEELLAKRVHVTHPVIGKIETVAPDGTSALVAGVVVRAEPGAIGAFEEGASAAISGIWRNDELIASRIDRIAAQPRSIIAGAVGVNPTTQKLTVAGIPLALGSENPPVGSFVTLSGTPSREEFRVSDLKTGRFTGAAGALTDLSVEGFLAPDAQAPFHKVEGLGHSFDPAAKLAGFRDQRTLFTGKYVGTFAVEFGVGLPEDLEQRRALFRSILQGNVPKTRASAR